MTPFAGFLSDGEIASVLTYVRNAFGNNAPPIDLLQVKKVRDEIKDHPGIFSPEELLKLHPMK